MSAYLFTSIAAVTRVHTTHGRYGDREVPMTFDSCTSSIVFGASADSAQERFEKFLRQPAEGEKIINIEIKSVTGAEFIQDLFTETGCVPLAWSNIVKQALTQTELTPPDDFEQGYWVDVDTVIRPEQSNPSIESLQQNLPSDISSELNWSGEKQFLYILTALTPPPPKVKPAEIEPDDDSLSASMDLQQLLTTYPQGAKKEAVALIQARNSAVAARLWRRFASGKRLASNQICIDPWCGTLGTPD